MGGFGQHLVAKGVLDAEQLEEALRFQQVYGGRIGTVIVDLGYLVVEELAEHLSDALGVPLPPPEWLESPDPQALKQIPPPIVRRCQALPLRIDDGELHVVMLDPTDPEKLDFLTMAASRPVVPYVLPERKLLYWLEVHCGLDRPPRFLGMLTRPRQIGLTKEEVESGTPMLDTRERIAHVAAEAVSREDALPETDATGTSGDMPGSADPAPTPPDALDARGGQPPESPRAPQAPLQLGTPIEDTSAEPTPPAPPATEHLEPEDRTEVREAEAHEAQEDREDEEDEEILLLDELVAETPAETPAWELDEEDAAPEPWDERSDGDRREPLSLRIARLESKLYQSRNRDEVIGLALEIARTFCVSASLFVVRGESVSLFRTGAGAAGDGAELDIPIRTPSLFTHPAQTGLPFRGQPASGGVDGRVLDGLGRGEVQEILVHPVVIRDRVVNLLYADNGPETFGETSIGALTALSHTLSGAYERLIADQKRQRSG